MVLLELTPVTDQTRPRGTRGVAIRTDGQISHETKRLIDVDDDKLDAVRMLLGATTLIATVDGAFDEVLALDQHRRALLVERGVVGRAR